ncbi:nitrilase-related carbon-nitrogen hydrolase [Armatimonas sp.]|uniref:carbon-nitrogen hydrolase family protein n=1 Tax=Armatimonas sp. TaxID=1872638 RepID=UPI00375125E6
MTFLTTATVCLSAACDVAANRATFLSYLKAAKAQGAELVLFPEIALQQNPGWGYISHVPTLGEKAYVARTAEAIPGESTHWLQVHLQALDLHMIFGMTEHGEGAEEGKLYNTSVFLGPGGVLARYRKHRLWDTETGGNEHCFWNYGDQAGLVVDSPWGKIGMMIANQGGTVGQTWDYGHSRIVAPDGTLIASTGKDEGMEMVTHAINWFEIPVSDFERAKAFYSAIFAYEMPVYLMAELCSPKRLWWRKISATARSFWILRVTSSPCTLPHRLISQLGIILAWQGSMFLWERCWPVG